MGVDGVPECAQLVTSALVHLSDSGACFFGLQLLSGAHALACGVWPVMCGLCVCNYCCVWLFLLLVAKLPWSKFQDQGVRGSPSYVYCLSMIPTCQPTLGKISARHACLAWLCFTSCVDTLLHTSYVAPNTPLAQPPMQPLQPLQRAHRVRRQHHQARQRTTPQLASTSVNRVLWFTLFTDVPGPLGSSTLARHGGGIPPRCV